MNMSDIITRAARDCARMLQDNGWNGPGHGYDLGSFHGDIEVLDTAIGREATREEREAFESEIRTELTFAARR